ncbi:hypothetical protein BDFB_005759 [Asbolus verrucosus]|uniref:Uncharacterized protein n=1 Tax=Asbolus verrucosus TaxID=1661398 RepID=A0A482WB47_ASBVE|nr:hypothetical protein BDFB_005759 [Asbolus verrucosus]
MCISKEEMAYILG